MFPTVYALHMQQVEVSVVHVTCDTMRDSTGSYVQVKAIMCSPLKRAQATAQAISKLQHLAHQKTPETFTVDGLTNRAVGEWEGRHALEVSLCTYYHLLLMCGHA